MGLASSHMASLKAWGEFQNNVDSQFLLIPNRHIVHSLKVWLPTDRPAGALPYIRTLRPKTIASADNRPQQLQNMSLLWFCMVVCCLRSQLLCVILGGRFGSLETAVWGGRCMTLHGILGLSTSRWFVSGSNSEGPSSQVTWEVLVPLHAGSSKNSKLQWHFWRFLSVWQTSCPPWFHGWSPETCEFHSVSFRVSRDQSSNAFVSTIGTRDPASLLGRPLLQCQWPPSWNKNQERLSQCYHIPSSIARGSTMKPSHHCPHVALASSSWGRNIGGQAAATSL